MGPLKEPPPVRRIVVDDEPTIVEPPKGPNGAGQTVKEGATALLSAPRKREGKRGTVKERMRTDELGVAYAGKPAVKAVSLPVNPYAVTAGSGALWVTSPPNNELSRLVTGRDG